MTREIQPVGDGTPEAFEAMEPEGFTVGLTTGGELVVLVFDVHDRDDQCHDIAFALEPDEVEALREMLRRILVSRKANLS